MADLLHQLMSDEPEVMGLLALIRLKSRDHVDDAEWLTEVDATNLDEVLRIARAWPGCPIDVATDGLLAFDQGGRRACRRLFRAHTSPVGMLAELMGDNPEVVSEARFRPLRQS